jgi:hypothetical protein
MADEKDEDIPDPWAGLDGAGKEEAKEDFAFSFDGLDGDAAIADLNQISDDDAAVMETVIESAIEASSPGLEAVAAEAVVEDDIADWLAEPAMKAGHDRVLNDTPLPVDGAKEPELAEATFDDTVSSPELGVFAGLEENPGEAGDGEDVSFPMVGETSDAELDAEVEEVVAELQSGEEVDHEPAAVVAMGGAAATAVARKPKASKKSGGGALGPILGGLLSLPIVFLILLGVLWGTGRDPIGMRSWLPSFLLPARQEGQAVAAATAKPPSLDDPGAAEMNGTLGETAVEGSASREPEATEPQPPTVPPEPASLVGDPLSPTIEPPTVGEPLLAAISGTPSVPMTEPTEAALAARPELPLLDLSGIDAAVEAALASMDRIGDAATGAGVERRRALVAWYKDLARVGTELAMLETVAADSGRPLDETPAAIATLYERLGNANDVAPDLKRLCRNWVDYARRPADGVLLVGVLDAARQVGPFWYTTLSLEQVDGTMRPLSLISRREPRADPGDRVAVAGVVFSEDTVWAADCGRLGATAAVEDDPF